MTRRAQPFSRLPFCENCRPVARTMHIPGTYRRQTDLALTHAARAIIKHKPSECRPAQF